jgi:hypothetical protein
MRAYPRQVHLQINSRYSLVADHFRWTKLCFGLFVDQKEVIDIGRTVDPIHELHFA